MLILLIPFGHFQDCRARHSMTGWTRLYRLGFIIPFRKYIQIKISFVDMIKKLEKLKIVFAEAAFEQ